MRSESPAACGVRSCQLRELTITRTRRSDDGILGELLSDDDATELGAAFASGNCKQAKGKACSSPKVMTSRARPIEIAVRLS